MRSAGCTFSGFSMLLNRGIIVMQFDFAVVCYIFSLKQVWVIAREVTDS